MQLIWFPRKRVNELILHKESDSADRQLLPNNSVRDPIILKA